MKIIERSISASRMLCECGCLFEYEPSDVKRESIGLKYDYNGVKLIEDTEPVVYCPKCNKRIPIRLFVI